MELRFDAMLYSTLANENSEAGHIKCSRGPHLACRPLVTHLCSKWIRQRLTHRWSQLDWNVVFITLDLLTSEDQICGKFWLPMKRMS